MGKRKKRNFRALAIFIKLVHVIGAIGIIALIGISYMNYKYDKFSEYDFINQYLSKPDIIDLTMVFPKSPIIDNNSNYVILHHDSIPHSKHIPLSSINDYHVSKGFYTFGYHYYITKDGKILKFHDHNERTAHSGAEWNGKAIGVCVNGNFEVDYLTEKQSVALSKLLQYLKKEVLLHKNVSNTKCPGPNFVYSKKYHFLQNIFESWTK